MFNFKYDLSNNETSSFIGPRPWVPLGVLKKEIPQVVLDDNGNIGKRYRRQDEIGTPFCITIDFDTLGETPEMQDTVTLRDRDTGQQQRVKIDELIPLLSKAIRA